MQPPSIVPAMSISGAGAYLRPHGVASQSLQPVAFSSGYLAGRTIRVHLEEIQKADVGRKFVQKDKRPLDPPPVVLCRFYEVLSRGSSRVEIEMDPEMMTDTVCHVELFPIPDGGGSVNAQPVHEDIPVLPPLLPTGLSSTSAVPMRPNPDVGTFESHRDVEPPMLHQADATHDLSSIPEELPPLHTALQSGYPQPQSSVQTSPGILQQDAIIDPEGQTSVSLPTDISSLL
ncbi:hypothetical protein ONZ51_g4454 [Trametes cubensis]|uniref:Velvet domain-containing protein n=1 Tax=Trametes cubensis TaxID=1111947 RepID=A0AAD7TVU6_9APHY|nr:hypothetical protein ONZ51_g4454 [Trametes cubensis]